MSRNAIVPARATSVERPNVVVLDQSRRARQAPLDNPLARFMLNVAPDLLRAAERSIARRNESRTLAPPPISLAERRVYASGMDLTEYDVDVRFPFVRQVTVRKASAWASNTPYVEPAPPPSPAPNRKLRAGVVGVGGVLALTALGLIANRAGGVASGIARRG